MIDYRAKFNEIYANLPLGARKEIIAVVDHEPVTWNVARLEIEQNTEKGKKIIDFLIKIGLLNNE